MSTGNDGKKISQQASSHEIALTSVAVEVKDLASKSPLVDDAQLTNPVCESAFNPIKPIQVDESSELVSTSTMSNTCARMISILVYGTVGLGISFTMRWLLGKRFAFPSFCFIAWAQCVVSALLLLIMQQLKWVNFSNTEKHFNKVFIPSIAWRVFPVAIFSVCNLISGLMGTKMINMAVKTALRRLQTLISMLLERVWLKIKFSRLAVAAVAVMIGGGALCAAFDFNFHLVGYLAVLANNIFGALYGATVKSRLSGDNQVVTASGLLYYNSLIGSFILTIVTFSWHPNTLQVVANWDGWSSPLAVSCFLAGILLGMFLNYTYFVCTQYNSSTTSSVVGSLKNLVVTYASVLGIDEGYKYNDWNFTGLNISGVGALAYTYVRISKKKKEK